jgi:hypothetical protein
MNRINNQGYIEVFVNNDWILEHRYVVENFLKRKLKTEEVVHHINGDKWDNHIENLMLFPSQKDHQSFHNKIKRFGWTRYRLEQVKNRWKNGTL